MTLRVHPDDIVRGSSSGLLRISPTWERVRLADVADVLNGFAFSSGGFSKSNGTPLLRIRDVGRSSTDVRYVGEFDATYAVDRGDIVVGMDGDFRVARWAGGRALLNQRVCKVTVRDEDTYSSAFLVYALPGYLEAIHAETSSVTVKHLSSRTIQDIPLPLPPVAEQRRIVSSIEEQFSRLDAADQSLRRAGQNLIRMRAAVVDIHLRQDAPRRPVETLVAAGRKIAYGVLQPGEHVPDGVPLVRVGDLQNGRVNIADLKRINPAIAASYPRTQVHGGEVLVSLVGTIGRTAVVPDSIRGANVARAVGVIPVSDEMAPEYVALALGNPQSAAKLVGLAHEVARKTLNLEDVRRFVIPVPPLEEQRRILREVERECSLIDALYDAVAAATRRSASLRRSILEKALAGRLVLQDPRDESASALLERIASDRAGTARARGHRTRLPV